MHYSRVMIKMRNIGKIFVVVFGITALMCAAHAADMSGTVDVNVTSDTAADAKSIAMNQARRQILNQVLGKYADASQVQVAVKDTSSSELMNLISSSSIDGEQLSDTAYSAKITMTVDGDAARKFLDANNIQNWFNDNNAGSVNGVMILISMSDRVANWTELKRIARDIGIDLNTRYMMGNQVTVEIPVNNRSAFVSAARRAGWHYSDTDGAIRIWK